MLDNIRLNLYFGVNPAHYSFFCNTKNGFHHILCFYVISFKSTLKEYRLENKQNFAESLKMRENIASSKILVITSVLSNRFFLF
jgi:hypothetical protein